MTDEALSIGDTDLVFDFSDDTDEAEEELEIHLDLDESEDDAEPVTEISLDFGDEAEAEAEPSLDDDLESARAEIRSDLERKNGQWYVIHTYSGMEKRVKQNLDSRVKTLNMEDFIFETVVPTEDVVEIRSGIKKTVTRTVLPGYVLVRMDLTDDSWSAVRHTPSVTGFVGHANNPVPLGLGEVVEMLLPAVMAQRTDKDGTKPVRQKKVELVDFQVGDSVMLTDGPFTGVHATITEINLNASRLKATLEFMGRDTPVDLTLDQVQKV